MVVTLRLFQSFREFCKLIGMHPSQLNEDLYNLPNFTGLLFMAFSSISAGAFFAYKADNIKDHSASFYTFVTESVSVGCFLSFRNNMSKVFELMDELEAFIKKSELETTHTRIYFEWHSEPYYKYNLQFRFQRSDRTYHVPKVEWENRTNLSPLGLCIDKN